jgi:phosphoenolpyruvate-protein kinase (PTS system EI component)
LEQLYLARVKPPTEEELLASIEEALTPVKDQVITIRLLDAGADKDILFLDLPAENNPFLGRRGVRLLRDYADLARTQLRVLLTLSQDHDIRILTPMVTVAEDIKEIRDLLQSVAKDMCMKQLPLLGAMVETPAAALCIEEIMQWADFLSIGTNDLTQFVMAAGRENNLVSQYYRDDHPAVLKLIQMIVKNAGDCPIEVCGELAGNLKVLSTLLRMGLRSVSVPPSRVPEIKAFVRNLEL